ncbi:MAG TPA: ligase-associated DNA damage response exonuclease [Bryobacteraceae bacterium]|nr:ligase-associated DNA damage response exonuclease [Bryobacteraceae bacterium]
MLEPDANGLYCPAGGFYVDPWLPVDRAVITHAHTDHARQGCGSYLTVEDGEALLRARMAEEAVVESVPYGASLLIGGVRVSFHPAGHIRGSAQVRIEHAGEIWVFSGDYKLAPDPTCPPFETVRCHTFVTESTFGLPIFRWRDAPDIIAEIEAWWRANREAGRPSLLFAYPLGKAQRILAGVDAAIGPIYTHGAVEKLNAIYKYAGVMLAPTTHVSATDKGDWSGALILAPPSANATPWARRFGNASRALASGWMRIRGARRRRTLDRGFVLSDHADWPALNQAIAASGAGRVLVTHGYRAPLVQWLSEQGRHAESLETHFGETGEEE